MIFFYLLHESKILFRVIHYKLRYQYLKNENGFLLMNLRLGRLDEESLQDYRTEGVLRNKV